MSETERFISPHVVVSQYAIDYQNGPLAETFYRKGNRSAIDHMTKVELRDAVARLKVIRRVIKALKSRRRYVPTDRVTQKYYSDRLHRIEHRMKLRIAS